MNMSGHHGHKWIDACGPSNILITLKHRPRKHHTILKVGKRLKQLHVYFTMAVAEKLPLERCSLSVMFMAIRIPNSVQYNSTKKKNTKNIGLDDKTAMPVWQSG